MKPRPAASLFKSPHKRTRAKLGDALTPMEREVIARESEGYTVGWTAHFLSMSTNTVETHRKNAYKKLGVRNAVQAANAVKSL